MKLSAIQKLTLLDFPEHVACTVFTAGCDFRCHYCHNSEFVLPEKLQKIAKDFIPEAVFFNFLEERRGLLEGVCITGGEPTMQPDLPEFLRKIKEMGFLAKLDTNGNHPEVLEKLYEEKLLDYVAMDIKASPSRYGEFAGVAMDSAKITKSRELIMASGIDYEFRTTLVREFHTDAEFSEILKFINGAKNYYLQNFQSSGGCLDADWEKYHGLTETELRERKRAAENHVQRCGIRK